MAGRSSAGADWPKAAVSYRPLTPISPQGPLVRLWVGLPACGLAGPKRPINSVSTFQPEGATLPVPGGPRATFCSWRGRPIADETHIKRPRLFSWPNLLAQSLPQSTNLTSTQPSRGPRGPDGDGGRQERLTLGSHSPTAKRSLRCQAPGSWLQASVARSRTFNIQPSSFNLRAGSDKREAHRLHRPTAAKAT